MIGASKESRLPIDTIAVIGSGIMDRGIAHAAAVGGFRDYGGRS